jgi:hypothetical protein
MLVKFGTIRDSLKWPKRAKRTCSNKRGIINFDLLSPYTVGRMLIAIEKLKVLLKAATNEYYVSGAMLKRYDAENAVTLYESAVKRYLLDMVLARAGAGIDSDIDRKDWFAVDADAVYDSCWVDLAGQMMPAARLNDIYSLVETGDIDTAQKFSDHMSSINECYGNDQWAWVVNAYQGFFGKSLDDISMQELTDAADELLQLNSRLTDALIDDAAKEYSDVSMIGFGMDGTDVEKDFQQVRGSFEDDAFVKILKGKLERLQNHLEQFKSKISAIE